MQRSSLAIALVCIKSKMDICRLIFCRTRPPGHIEIGVNSTFYRLTMPCRGKKLKRDFDILAAITNAYGFPGRN
jgi:hypothetical protein